MNLAECLEKAKKTRQTTAAHDVLRALVAVLRVFEEEVGETAAGRGAAAGAGRKALRMSDSADPHYTFCVITALNTHTTGLSIRHFMPSLDMIREVMQKRTKLAVVWDSKKKVFKLSTPKVLIPKAPAVPPLPTKSMCLPMAAPAPTAVAAAAPPAPAPTPAAVAAPPPAPAPTATVAPAPAPTAVTCKSSQSITPEKGRRPNNIDTGDVPNVSTIDASIISTNKPAADADATQPNTIQLQFINSTVNAGSMGMSDAQSSAGQKKTVS